MQLPLLETAARFAAVPAADLAALPASIATWVLASKLAIELVARERVVPAIARRSGRIEARWAAALSASDDAARVAALARSMPPAAHAVPVGDGDGDGDGLDVWAPDALLRAYLDAVVDALVRAARGGLALPAAVPAPVHAAGSATSAGATWDRRWRAALSGPQRSFEAHGFAERSVVDELVRWSEPALGARDRLRACFRLELPARDGEPFVLRFLLQSPDDPSLLVPAAEVWQTKGRSLAKLGRAFRDPQESLLEALGRACRVYPALAPALEQARPEAVELDPAAAWSFLGEGAALLGEAGFGVIVPAELTSAGQRRLRLRMRAGGTSRKVAGAVSGAAGLGLDELIAVDWQAVIGEHALSAQELAALAKHKAPLVRFRGAWVAIDPRELSEIQQRLAAGPGQMTVRDAVQAALAGEARQGSAWTAAIAGMAEKAQFSAELLAGQMPQQIDEVFRAAGTSLFPAQRAELTTDCSCPDWGDPCKHIAAAHYVLGEALDRDPFLLFELRGRSRDQVLDALRTARAPEGAGFKPAHCPSQPEAPTVAFGHVTRDDYDQAREPLPSLHFSFDAPLTHGAVVRQLGAPAAWNDEASSPADALAPLIRAAAESARSIALAEPQLPEPQPTKPQPTGKDAPLRSRPRRSTPKRRAKKR